MADIKVLPQVSAFLAQEHGQFIDGQLIPAAGGQRLPVVNPANGQTIANVAGATADEVEQAMQSADRALKGEWGKSLPAQRQQILGSRFRQRTRVADGRQFDSCCLRARFHGCRSGFWRDQS